MKDNPFENFEEQIKPEHWQAVHTKLTTPSFEATLTPDGRLKLQFGNIETLLERDEVVSLTRFLDQHAQVEPLAPPEEPEWFKNFEPTPVTVDITLPPTDARLDPDYQPQEGDTRFISYSQGNYNIHSFTGEKWEELPTYLPAHAAKVLASRMQFLGTGEGYSQYYRPIETDEQEDTASTDQEERE